jgi:hypothetical protein
LRAVPPGIYPIVDVLLTGVSSVEVGFYVDFPSDVAVIRYG